MVAGLDIEFEDEDEAKPKSKTPEAEIPDVSLEFSATTDVINLAAHKEELSKQAERTEPEESSAPKVEISEEMKAVVDKVKSENAQVRSISDARQKKPAPAPAPQVKTSPPLQKAVVQTQAAPKAPVAQTPTVNEESLLGKLDAFAKVQLEAELRVAKAEAKGETMAFYLSEMKLLEYQVMTLIKRLGVKTPEGQKVIEQIQRQFSVVTKKKPS